MSDSTRRFLLVLACVVFSAFTPTATWAQDASSTLESGAPPVWSIDTGIGPIEYRAGRGLRFERFGLNIGGFTTLEIDAEQGKTGELAIDALSFLVLYEPIDAFRIFSEIAIDDIVEYETGGSRVSSKPGLVAERIYGEFGTSDRFNVRFGKFQTPIGIYNIVPAEPFQWTAEDPLVVERAFDEHHTGAMLYGSLNRGARALQYALFSQFLEPLSPDRSPAAFEKTVGWHIGYGSVLDDWSLGLSYLAAELDNDWQHLIAADGLWRRDALEITSELVWSQGDVRGRSLWSIYVQGVYELVPTFNLVARYEHFAPRGSERNVDLGDVGVAWIPLPHIHLRAFYRFANRENGDTVQGFNGSISVLF